MKRHEVLLTEGAERDLEELHRFISESDSAAKADRLLDELLDLARSFATLPERGSVPKELRVLGIKEYRQALLGPYRVIYRRVDERVLIHLIADGRRDMQTLLARRLLTG